MIMYFWILFCCFLLSHSFCQTRETFWYSGLVWDHIEHSKNDEIQAMSQPPLPVNGAL